ncbi:MAG: hypothetical protein F4Y37_07365 [Caldilineaceae bacterium SB0664_bin_22]|nr:hypothetical protein [Caldilineaceae bacterium SB0664_bin_22]
MGREVRPGYQGARMDGQVNRFPGQGRMTGTEAPVVRSEVDFFLSDLQLLIAWAIRERGAGQIGDLLDSMSGTDSRPAELDHLWRTLRTFELRSLVDLSEVDADLNRSFDDLLAVVEPRRITLFKQRKHEGRPLEQVGRNLGVTRERVRQLEKETERFFEHAVQVRTNFRWFRIRAQDLRAKLGLGAPVGHAATLDAMESALRGLHSGHRWLARILLLECAGPYQTKGDWFALNWSELTDRSDVLACMDANSLTPVSAARQVLVQRGLRPEFFDAWLLSHGRMRRIGTHLVDSGNVVDKCAAMLVVLQRPATAVELVEMVGEGHNSTGVRYRLMEDPRFVRVNKTELALKTWGMDEYEGITQEIWKYILAAGGEATVADIATSIVNRFGVKRTSVALYVQAPMFELQGRRVRIKGGPGPDKPHPEGEGVPAPGLFDVRRGQVNLFVDAEAVRGSGRPCNVELCHALGIEPGQHRRFRFAAGSVHVGWPATSPYPNLGSVRELIRHIGASLGDRVLLEFDSSTGKVEASIQPTDQ